eukprot:649262-Prymnesium_polylepis.1
MEKVEMVEEEQRVGLGAGVTKVAEDEVVNVVAGMVEVGRAEAEVEDSREDAMVAAEEVENGAAEKKEDHVEPVAMGVRTVVQLEEDRKVMVEHTVGRVGCTEEVEAAAPAAAMVAAPAVVMAA